jgi:hypothetical protein
MVGLRSFTNIQSDSQRTPFSILGFGRAPHSLVSSSAPGIAGGWNPGSANRHRCGRRRHQNEFLGPETYSGQTVFNLANNAAEAQLEFLGSGVAKVVLAAKSSRSPDSMLAAGAGCGLSVFALGRTRAGRLSDLENRTISWRLERHADGSYPLQQFKTTIMEAIEQFQARQPVA